MKRGIFKANVFIEIKIKIKIKIIAVQGTKDCGLFATSLLTCGQDVTYDQHSLVDCFTKNNMSLSYSNNLCIVQ